MKSVDICFLSCKNFVVIVVFVFIIDFDGVENKSCVIG